MQDQTQPKAVSGEAFHAVDATDALQELGAAADAGLTQAEAERRLKEYGANELLTRRRVTTLQILFNQVKSPVVLLLAAAALVSLLLGEWIEAIAIIVVLAVNTAIGFVTEMRAVRSMEALRQLGSRCSRVRRDGRTKTGRKIWYPATLSYLGVATSSASDRGQQSLVR